MIVDIIYFAMVPFTWWYMSRIIAWKLKYHSDSKPEGVDYLGAIFIGFFISWLWFLVLPGYALFNAIGQGNGVKAGMDAIFPEPVPRAKKKEMKAKAKQEEIIRFRNEVNARERELQMVPTVWSE